MNLLPPEQSSFGRSERQLLSKISWKCRGRHAEVARSRGAAGPMNLSPHKLRKSLRCGARQLDSRLARERHPNPPTGANGQRGAKLGVGVPEDETQHAEGSLKVIAERKAKTAHTFKGGPPHSRKPHGNEGVEWSLPAGVIVALAITTRAVGLARETRNDSGRGSMSESLKDFGLSKVTLNNIQKMERTVESGLTGVMVVSKDRGESRALKAISKATDATKEVSEAGGDRAQTTNSKAS